MNYFSRSKKLSSFVCLKLFIWCIRRWELGMLYLGLFCHFLGLYFINQHLLVSFLKQTTLIKEVCMMQGPGCGWRVIRRRSTCTGLRPSQTTTETRTACSRPASGATRWATDWPLTGHWLARCDVKPSHWLDAEWSLSLGNIILHYRAGTTCPVFTTTLSLWTSMLCAREISRTVYKTFYLLNNE